MNIFSIIMLLGGLAMFLYGMEVMSDGLKNASGTALKRVLEKVTSNAFMGVLTGTLVTAVIQSSTATIVIAVGLITAGILNLKQAVSIVLGANIGTTVTAQIIRLMDIDSGGNMVLEFFKPSTLAPIAMVAGIILIMFVKKSNSKPLGEIFAGFGVLFTGLMNMTASVEPLSESQMFIDILGGFSDMPLLGIIAGLVLTMIVQSSSAMVGMLQALSVTGVMTMNLVYPIIMGINLGTCVTTAMVCSIGSSKDAKRTGIAHIVFNVVGTILFMIFMEIFKAIGLMPDFWGKIVDSGDIANFQTIFNLVTAIVLVPFTGLLVKLTYVFVKPDKEPKKMDDYAALHTLDEKLYVVPQIAIAEATSAIGVMGRLAHQNFRDSITQLDAFSEETSVGINTREEKLDEFTDTVENFLVGLAKTVQSDEQSEDINILVQTTTDFERIGDYATNINEFAERIKKDQVSFSTTAIEELAILFGAVSDIIDLAVNAFVENDDEMAKKVEPLEEVIDDMVQYLRDSHINRLKTGECTVNSGIIFIETLTYLERASDQCSSVAILQLSKNNPQIRENHHDYLRELHKETDQSYVTDLRARREQYLKPLLAVKGK
ncbi:MAG: Na/Pi cotransporter family protein [Clostridia bacterium]|nr:Na/Pi cotransporter family protein [Clostridia bacterium]MBQ9996469.1 Na/Pi cotransporter family protein [Clostridia bacterium]